MKKRTSARPKYLLIGAVFALLLVSLVQATPAISHGTCTAPAYKPTHATSTTFQGMLDCTDVHAFQARLNIQAQRRTPGQSFVTYAQWYSGNRAPTADIGPVAMSVPGYDCHKDYRTHTFGTAQNSNGGVGHSPQGYSSILYHTC